MRADIRETNPVLERFFEATNITSIADLADSLGISRQAIYSALNNDKFPKEWYFKVAEMTECSMDWLAHGIGPKKRAKPDNSPADSNFPDVIDSMVKLLVGTSGNISEMNRCTIMLCEKLLSQKEAMKNSPREESKSSPREEKKNSRLINIKQFAYKVASYAGA